MGRRALPLRWRLGLLVGCLVVAAGIWLPNVHRLFLPRPQEVTAGDGIAPMAAKLAEYHLHTWSQPQLLQQNMESMRRANAEWDFMGRSFLSWSLANMAMREPGVREPALRAIDRIIDNTLELEREEGFRFFLLPYANSRQFVQQPARSQFTDGEIALMLGLRCMVADRDDYRRELARRVGIMVRRMEASPTLSAESYPNECWTFCNTIALAAIRVHDLLSGEDHTSLLRRWVAMAKRKLVDSRTGLLVAAYRLDGARIYGPEGSTAWVASHCLMLVDQAFAREQYDRARQHLSERCLGFAYAREWPAGTDDGMDIDSGAVVPGLGASVASSGLAFVAAGSFGDVDFLRRLAATLEFAAFPVDVGGGRHYAASNLLGDAVVLYGLTAGPAWDRLQAARAAGGRP